LADRKKHPCQTSSPQNPTNSTLGKQLFAEITPKKTHRNDWGARDSQQLALSIYACDNMQAGLR
jgi:hypothetical protein